MLLNKTLAADTVNEFLRLLVTTSKTDDGDAVQVLLQDGRSEVHAEMLDIVLQKDFSLHGDCTFTE